MEKTNWRLVVALVLVVAVIFFWVIPKEKELVSVLAPKAEMQQPQSSATPEPTISAPEVSETEAVLNKYGLTATRTVAVGATINTNN